MRLLNAVGHRLPPLSLDCHRLLALARRHTGLEDFGDASFPPALERLCNALQQEARLSTLGRMIVRRSLLDRLCYRLRLVDYRRQHPEVAEQTISRPLLIAGMPRTGTTILYELLAQDPQHRFPLSWEVERPVPPPSADSLHSDPRIAAVQRQFDQVDRLIPDFKSIHEIGVELPQECVSILAYHFMSELWNVGYDIPSHRD